MLSAALLTRGAKIPLRVVNQREIVSGALKWIRVGGWRIVIDPELTPAAGHNLTQERVWNLRRWKGVVLIYPTLRLNEVPHPVR